jgi:hypothetical protein
MSFSSFRQRIATMIKQASESLAGRIEYLHLNGFGLDDLPPNSCKNDGFEADFPDRSPPCRKRQALHAQSVYPDLSGTGSSQLGVNVSATPCDDSDDACALYGQTWNASEFGRSFGVAGTTARNYLDRLTDAWWCDNCLHGTENISKRLPKRPRFTWPTWDPSCSA